MLSFAGGQVRNRIGVRVVPIGRPANVRVTPLVVPFLFYAHQPCSLLNLWRISNGPGIRDR